MGAIFRPSIFWLSSSLSFHCQSCVTVLNQWEPRFNLFITLHWLWLADETQKPGTIFIGIITYLTIRASLAPRDPLFLFKGPKGPSKHPATNYFYWRAQRALQCPKKAGREAGHFQFSYKRMNKSSCATQLWTASSWSRSCLVLCMSVLFNCHAHI